MKGITHLTKGLSPIHWGATTPLQVQLPDSSRSVLALQLTPTTLLTYVFLPISQVPPLSHPAWPGKDVLPSTHVIQQEVGDG